MKMRATMTAAVAVLIAAHAIATTPASTGAGLWAQVPPLPTACYAENDAAYDKLRAAHDSIQQDHDRQNEVNAAVDQQARGNDMMDVASRMQEEMMRDPQAAAKLIEQMSNPDAAAQQQAQRTATFEEDDRIRKNETKALKARYDAALQTADGPAQARWSVLRQKLGLGPDAYGPGESGVPDWAWAEWHEIQKMRDQAYQATCPAWFGAGGQVQAHLQRYKTFLTQTRIPAAEELDRKKLEQYETVYRIPTTGYKSVATHAAAEAYIDLAEEMYQWRDSRPKCPGGKCTA
jgi:hypothetical protein